MKLPLIYPHLTYHSYTSFCFTTVFQYESASNILSSISQLENARICHQDTLLK